MNVAQSELDIYLSREKKEKQVLESMKEELATATTKFTELQKSLKDLENNLPAWSKAIAEKQAQLNQVNFIIPVALPSLLIFELTFIDISRRS